MASRDLLADDGHRILIYEWPLDSGAVPRAVVQIFHGLGEHAGRYERFADVARQNSFAVVAHDHRGHGPNADLPGHYADNEGWNKVISDARLVQTQICSQHPDLPIVLLGNSMGSYIAQSFAMRHPENLTGLILSGSTFSSRLQLRLANLLAAALAAAGPRTVNQWLNQQGLGNFNKPFRPNRTEFDWLSRDHAEVDLYLSDAYCGGQFSNQLWQDLTGGLIEISSEKAVATVPKELPILVIGGEDDPVGGRKGMTKLTDTYQRTGHKNLALKIYDGGRHEMLNETNRDEVTADILAWIDQILKI